MKKLPRYLLLLLLACGVLCSPLPSRERIRQIRSLEFARFASSIGPEWLDSTEARASQFSCLTGGSPFLSTSTWTVPGNIYDVIACGYAGGGGGGSGASAATNSSGGGGGGGALYACGYTNVTPGATPTVTVGAGGTAGAAVTGAVGNAGGTGGASSFGVIQWNGASGGAGGNSTASAVTGGGLAITSRNVNDYNTITVGSISGVSASGCVHSPQCGGCAPSDANGQAGDDALVSNGNRLGGAGGTANTAGGGGGGGGGPNANGGTGGAGSTTTTAGAGGSPANNSGAGAGGGGGTTNASDASGAGGVGGSGKIWICTTL